MEMVIFCFLHFISKNKHLKTGPTMKLKLQNKIELLTGVLFEVES